MLALDHLASPQRIFLLIFMNICENLICSFSEQTFCQFSGPLTVLDVVERAGPRITLLTDETNFKLMRILAERPDISQRDLAEELGVSLGKVNYCLRALLQKSWVKVQNFRNSSNKISYSYFLTPAGFEAKRKLTVAFLKRKQAEYEGICREIDRLQHEVELQNNAKTKSLS